MHGIDFTPLIPVINGLIVAIASVLTLATPVLVAYLGIWLRNHGIAAKQAGLQIVSERINATIQNGIKYATTAADDGVKKLNVTTGNQAIDSAANYAILQSPELLKQGGIDVTTTEGQQALVRRVTAAAAPPPPSPPGTIDVSLSAKPQ
jgi:hypothetical protein